MTETTKASSASGPGEGHLPLLGIHLGLTLHAPPTHRPGHRDTGTARGQGFAPVYVQNQSYLIQLSQHQERCGERGTQELCSISLQQEAQGTAPSFGQPLMGACVPRGGSSGHQGWPPPTDETLPCCWGPHLVSRCDGASLFIPCGWALGYVA